MLDTLRAYNSQDAANILAAVALMSAPNPGLDDPPLVKRYGTQLNDVAREIRGLLKIPSDDDSPASRSKFDSALAKMLAETVLENKNKGEILSRIGQSGKLSPSAYQIDLNAVPPVFYQVGTRKGHILDAVQHADDVQHLRIEANPKEKPLSIFVRLVPQRREEDTFWLLVYSHRLGMTQVVQNVLRIYPADFDISECKVPLDLLRLLAMNFGLEIGVGNRRGKFIENEYVEVQDLNIITTPTVYDEANKIFVTTMSATPINDPPRLYVSVAYAIDFSKYVPYLLSHHVDVSRAMREEIQNRARARPNAWSARRRPPDDP